MKRIFVCLADNYMYRRADTKLIARYAHEAQNVSTPMSSTSLANGDKEGTACHSLKHAENLQHSWINNPFSR
jgi:hypothetical protein